MAYYVYVIVKTTNEERGSDSLLDVYGMYEDGHEAEVACESLRAELPGEYASHEDNPIDYTVMEVRT